MDRYRQKRNAVISVCETTQDLVGLEERSVSTNSWSSGFNTPSSLDDELADPILEQIQVASSDENASLPSATRVLTRPVSPGELSTDTQDRMMNRALNPPVESFGGRGSHGREGVNMDDLIFHVLVRTPERFFRQEVTLDAFYQHRLDASQKSAALRHVLRKNTNLFLRDSIGDSILHTLAGDFGPPDLSSETEGFDILTQFFDSGTSGFGPLVKSCCLSMINSQNDGYHMTEKGVAEPFLHTPLGVAILYNNLKCAELLLQHGADPNIPGEWGRTPLFFADRNSSEEAVRLLVDYGAHM